MNDSVRLNKYIANTGLCSRREADKLIEQGRISVNDKIVTELGVKINPRKDKVQYERKVLKSEKLVYILLNKPKDYITTTDDPQERKTVMHLIKNACKERVYPVGRLDRNTTGLLLLTNDGELTKKLSHPSHKIKKTYQITTDKAVKSKDLEKLVLGFELEDGWAKANIAVYLDELKNKREVLIELHSGRNRIIRRMFNALDYEVEKLDRIQFTFLTKKNLPRGKWRHLTTKEVGMLKMR